MLKCVIPNWFLAWKNLDSRVTDESPTKGFSLDDLSKLCCRCAKLRNIADVDTCLPDPTSDEVIMSNVDPIVVGKVKAKAERIASSQLKEPSDATKKINSQNDAHYHSVDNVNDLVQSFDLVMSFDYVQPFDLVRSFDQRTRKMVDPSVILLPHVLPTDPDHVVEDALAQGAEGLGLMQNEDHQVLGNEQKLEEDAPDCTRVDDDGVEFSPEGGDYFPTIGDETKKDKCSIFLLLLIICLVLMLMERVSYLQSIQRRSGTKFMFLLLKDALDSLNKEIFEDLKVCKDALDRSLSLAEILKIKTMSSLGTLNR
ncbi:hypothetical protein Tco_1318553 [Tanacetum coccineum]